MVACSGRVLLRIFLTDAWGGSNSWASVMLRLPFALTLALEEESGVPVGAGADADVGVEGASIL